MSQFNVDKARRGQQFERACLWFLTHEPAYARLMKSVWLWSDWPGRWGLDAGIDIVAEDKDGKLWAIQAKAYDPAYAITRRDINGFLAESGRLEHSSRLIMATTNLLSATAKSTLDAQQKPVAVLLLDDLEAAEVEWPDSPSEL
jgi:predicted helicase